MSPVPGQKKESDMDYQEMQRFENNAPTFREKEEFEHDRRVAIRLLIAAAILVIPILACRKMEPPLTVEFVSEWLEWKHYLMITGMIISAVVALLALGESASVLKRWRKEHMRQLAWFSQTAAPLPETQGEIAQEHMYEYQWRLTCCLWDYFGARERECFAGHLLSAASADGPNGTLSNSFTGMFNGHVISAGYSEDRHGRLIKMIEFMIDRTPITGPEAEAFYCKYYDVIHHAKVLYLTLARADVSRQAEFAEYERLDAKERESAENRARQETAKRARAAAQDALGRRLGNRS